MGLPDRWGRPRTAALRQKSERVFMDDASVRRGCVERTKAKQPRPKTKFYSLNPPRNSDISRRTMSLESLPGQQTQANSEYVQRINRVIDYLRGNLDRQVK